MKSIIVFLGVSIFFVVMSCEGSYNSSELINVEYKEGANVEEDLINESLNALKTQSDTLYLNLKNDSLNIWSAKAERIEQSTQRLVNILVLECSEMIETAERESWYVSDENGCLTLKGLSGIKQKDNWDVPMLLFVKQNGGERGRFLREAIHIQRDSICILLGSYIEGENDWNFEPTFDGESLVEFDMHATIVDRSMLNAALEDCNPKDTSKIANIYMSLSQPKLYENHGSVFSWEETMFDHAPLIAAASIFNAFILDIRNAENKAVVFICDKVDVE